MVTYHDLQDDATIAASTEAEDHVSFCVTRNISEENTEKVTTVVDIDRDGAVAMVGQLTSWLERTQ